MKNVPDDRISRPILVGHRGYAAHYPENTLVGIEAALNAGAQFIEVDIQVSADGVPVLFHDATLTRTTGAPGTIMSHTLAQIGRLSAGENERLGKRFNDTRIPTLSALIEMLLSWPGVSVFLELKEESLSYHGIAAVVSSVIQLSLPLAERRILISYNTTAIKEVHQQGQIKTGWILKKYNDKSLHSARTLGPDYLICNYTKLPDTAEPLWPGHWSWVLYEITDPELALHLYKRGGHLIETMSIGEMHRHHLFK